MGARLVVADGRDAVGDPAGLELGHARLPLVGEGPTAAFVSNGPKDAAEIEQRHTNGKGLLYADGASRANLVSGDAPHSMITLSTLREKREGRLGQDYLAFFSNPYDVTRTIILVVKEIVAELWQQTQQKRQDIEPRVHRGWFPIRSCAATPTCCSGSLRSPPRSRICTADGR